MHCNILSAKQQSLYNLNIDFFVLAKRVVSMGYVEDIRKINDLAKELQKHNIASSSDDAVIKAREMLLRKTGSVVHSEEYIDLSKQAIPQATVEQRSIVSENSSGWKEAMAKNNEYIVTELKKFRADMDAMQSLRNEIASLKSEFSALKRNGVSVQAQSQQQQQQQPQQMQTANNTINTNNNTTNNSNNAAAAPNSNSNGQPVEQKREFANHPRAGNYTSADVDINKFFYYGNKR